MCGIIGVMRSINPTFMLNYIISSLRKMDYRGYDSWGYTIINEKGEFQIRKEVGRIPKVEVEGDSYMGIAHTRWATNGGVTKINAHPHLDCKNEIAIVHNGIITNAISLKSELEKKGHIFKSETDSEIIAHLFEEEKGPLFEKAKIIVKKLKGSFAIIAIDGKNPNEMVAIKYESPLIIGIGKDEKEIVVASDPIAFLEQTKTVYFVDDGDIVLLKRGNSYNSSNPTNLSNSHNHSIDLFFYNYLKNEKVNKKTQIIDWKKEQVELNGYPHYMLKEIMEQPFSLRKTMGKDNIAIAEKFAKYLEGKHVVAVACGTARHASVIGKHLLYRIAKFQIEVMMAHEFTYFVKDAPKDTVVLAVSQSGETADVLEVVRKAKFYGLSVASIVNVISSTLARESDIIFPLHCGSEIAVASTKAFSSQVLVFYLISYAMVNKLDKAREMLGRLIVLMEKKLPYFDQRAKEIAEKIYKKQHMYVLGKGVNFAIALEGALKIKEVSYIHAEGMPSGELKHGTLALIEKGTPVILIAPTDYTYDDVLSNGLETKARGAFLIGLSNQNHPSFDEYIDIGNLDSLSDKIFYPLLESIPLQLIAYHSALLLERDVDKPRNLAKSVTVK